MKVYLSTKWFAKDRQKNHGTLHKKKVANNGRVRIDVGASVEELNLFAPFTGAPPGVHFRGAKIPRFVITPRLANNHSPHKQASIQLQRNEMYAQQHKPESDIQANVQCA